MLICDKPVRADPFLISADAAKNRRPVPLVRADQRAEAWLAVGPIREGRHLAAYSIGCWLQ
jgi:hypothetical protein